MAFKVKSVAMLTITVIAQVPREISRFCWYFMDSGGLLETRVWDTVCRISPIPNKDLEIPVTLIMKKRLTNSEVFRKMKHFLEEFYIEQDLIKKPGVKRWWDKWRVCSSWRRKRNKYSWGQRAKQWHRNKYRCWGWWTERWRPNECNYGWWTEQRPRKRTRTIR